MMMLTLDRLFEIPIDKLSCCEGKTFVGIDFGTSTTVVSIASLEEDGGIGCKSIELEQKMSDGVKNTSRLVPTVICYQSNSKVLLVGQGAYADKGNPTFQQGVNLWHSFKMELGMDMGPLWYKSELKGNPNNPNDPNKIDSPQTAARMFFRYLKDRILDYCKKKGLSTDLHYAVSIPASFESNQRNDLLNALRENQIGITGFNFIDEPNAAFISYINPDEYRKEEITFPDDKYPKVLVFDFGAGTCDISILEVQIDHFGIHARNISISQFKELGGNNIDNFIAHEYLLPRLFEANNAKMSDYRTDQLNLIEQQLTGIAEKLKIAACKDFEYILTDPDAYDYVIKEQKMVSVCETVDIEANYGNLRQDKFSISYADFIRAMETFVSRADRSMCLRSCGSQRGTYNSITDNIESAINKAGLEKSDIDFVMMVGGSSKNPFVKNYIKKYFPQSTKVLIPQDMQTLVSQGAAIHSLLHNAFGIDVVKPITSESIIAVVENGDEMMLIPAGTEIPFEPIVFEKFSTGDRDMGCIEIPICVSSKKKCLCTLKIHCPSGEETFPRNAKIKLTIGMSADKVLKVSASCDGEDCEIANQNPFANTYLTDSDIAILKAQRAANIAASVNGGVPTQESLVSLRKAYEDADRAFLAAETMETELEYYPNEDQYNRLGVLYSNGGNRSKAMQMYKKALEVDPDNVCALVNLGHDYYCIGKNDKAEALLRKALELRPDYAIALIALGDVLIEKRITESTKEALEVRKQAYTLMKRKWERVGLSKCELGWFIDVAEDLKYTEDVAKARMELNEKKVGGEYNLDNLVSVIGKTNKEADLFDNLNLFEVNS